MKWQGGVVEWTDREAEWTNRDLRRRGETDGQRGMLTDREVEGMEGQRGSTDRGMDRQRGGTEMDGEMGQRYRRT